MSNYGKSGFDPHRNKDRNKPPPWGESQSTLSLTFNCTHLREIKNKRMIKLYLLGIILSTILTSELYSKTC